jgi:hypothetical protein
MTTELWKAIFTSGGTALCSLAVGFVVHYLQKNARLRDLAIIATICGQALNDALRAAGTAPKTAADKTAILEAAFEAAKVRILENMPEIESALEAELDVLIHGNIKQLALVTTPGNSVVTLPVPGGTA